MKTTTKEYIDKHENKIIEEYNDKKQLIKKIIIKDCGCKDINEYNNKQQLIKTTFISCDKFTYINIFEYNEQGKLIKKTVFETVFKNLKKKFTIEYDSSNGKEIKYIYYKSDKTIDFITEYYDVNEIVKYTFFTSNGENVYFQDVKNHRMHEIKKGE